MRNRFDMADENLSMVRGDTFAVGISFDGLDDGLESASFTCGGLFQKSIGDGITRNANGDYIVVIDPDDTKDAVAGFYLYDLKVGINDDVYTLMHGTLEIMQDVTFTSTPPTPQQAVVGTAIVGTSVI